MAVQGKKKQTTPSRPYGSRGRDAERGFDPWGIVAEGVETELERETRFELATSTLARLHSTTELFPLMSDRNKRGI